MASQRDIKAGRAFVELTTKNKIGAGLKRAQAQLVAWGKTMLTVGAGAIAGAVTGATIAAKAFANMGSEMNDAAARTGASVEALSALKYAAEQAGTSFEGVEIGVKKMQKALASNDKAFAALGLNVKDMLKLSPDEQFAAIGEKLAKIQNPAQRAAMAMKIFGKSGTELLPMLTDNLGDTIEQARALGLVMSTEDARAADMFGDTLDRLWAQVKMVTFHIGGLIATSVQPWADKAAEAVGNLLNMFGGANKVEVATILMKMGFLKVKDFAVSIWNEIGDAMVSAFTKAWAGVQQIGVGVFGVWEALISNIGDFFVKTWVNASAGIEKIFTKMSAATSKSDSLSEWLTTPIGATDEEKKYRRDLLKKQNEDIDAAAKNKMDALNKERDAALKNIDEINAAEKQQRDKAVADRIAAIEKERDARLQNIEEGRTRGADARIQKLQSEMDSLMSSLKDASVSTALDRFFGPIENGAGLTGAATAVASAMKAAVKAASPIGVFSTAGGAGLSLQGGGTMVDLARETAKNTKDLVTLAKRGKGLVVQP